MSDSRANIKVSREFYEHHNPRREDLGLTWEEYIDGQAPDVPEADVDTEAVARAVSRELDYDHLAGMVAGKVVEDLR